MIDKIKLLLAILLGTAGIVGVSLLSEQPAILRLLAFLAGAVAAVAVFGTTEMGRRAFTFFKEALNEARKVVWPNRKETIRTTTIVFVLALVMGLILWVVDSSLLWLVKQILGRGA